MAINSANQVTRMGMEGSMWQPHGSYANKVPADTRVSGGMLSAKHVRRRMNRRR